MTIKILAIGDLHGKIPKNLPENIDLILLTGDLGKARKARKMAFENVKRMERGLAEKEYSAEEEKEAFMESYNSAIQIVKKLKKIAKIYTIYGNVERNNKETRELEKEMGLSLPFLSNKLRKMGVRIINNRLANFHGIKIGGVEYFTDVSWVKEFKPDNFKERLKSAQKEIQKIKNTLKWFGSLDILLCHQPPFKILDQVGESAPKSWKGKHAGSKLLLDYIKKYKPQFVFCGHIHEAAGEKMMGKTKIINLGLRGYKLIDI